MRRRGTKNRKHGATDFILACIRLYPWETGESIVRRVMTVAPEKWSKDTLVTTLSRLHSSKRVIAKEWEQRAGKDQRSLVYGLPPE